MVPVAYWPTLAVVAGAILALRALMGRPLLHRFARPLDTVSAIILVIAGAALAFHCAAMFFPRPVEVLPLLSTHARSIRGLQLGSELAFWVPAGVAIVALRMVWFPALAVLTLSLVAVGWSMFDGRGLMVHLGAIAVSVVVGLTVVAGMLGSPTEEGAMAVPGHRGDATRPGPRALG